MMKKASLLIFILLISVFIAKGQLTISADLSPRTELRHGYRVLPLENESLGFHTNQRTRLNFGFLKDNVRIHVSLQDVKVWGQEAQKMIVPSTALHQGWVELLFTDSLMLKIGRQELRYDNQRFLAINDWIPMAQKHDVVLFKHISNAGELHLGTALNQPWDAYNRNFNTSYGINNYKYMSFAWYHTRLGNMGDISLLGIADGYEHSEFNGTLINADVMYVRGTLSAYTRLKVAGFDWMINPAYQTGSNRRGQEIDAWYFRTDLSRSFIPKTRSVLGVEVLSGNDATRTDDSKDRAFDVTHGAGHVHLGLMDYFTNIPAHTRRAGLVNPFLKNTISLSEKTTFGTELHLFYIQNNFVSEGRTIDKYLGTELDFTLNYKYNDFTTLFTGFSWMFASESMEIINRGNVRGSSKEPAYFAHVMLRVRPRLL